MNDCTPRALRRSVADNRRCRPLLFGPVLRTLVRTSWLWLLCLAWAGCASPYAYYCDDGCGGPCAVSGRFAECGGMPCGDCDVVAGAAAPCDVPCAAPCPPACGPCVGTLTGLLRSIFTCGAGCGEVYWGEWCYDPPDACDPCNDHGDFVGPGCCGPTGWLLLWRGLHGERYCPVGCETGCSVCCDVPCAAGPACGCDTPAGTILDETLLDGGMYETIEPLMEPLEAVPAPPPQDPKSVSVLSRRPRSAAQPYYSRDSHSRVVRRPYR